MRLTSMARSILISLFFAIACAPIGPVPIDVSGYDTECEADNDCVMVATEKCAWCSACGGHAISRVDYDAYQQEFDSTSCQRREGAPPPCEVCEPYQAACIQGQCTTKPTTR